MFNHLFCRRAILPYQNSAKEFFSYNLVLLIVLLILLLGAFSTFCLSGIHLYVAICNVTTWEFVSSHRISYLKDREFGWNPFHLGYLRNMFVFLFACSVQDWENIYKRNIMTSGTCDETLSI